MSSGVEWRRTGRRILLDLLILRPEPATDLTSIPVRALLDTGASSSGVSIAIAEALTLPSIGKEPILTAGGLIQAERFLFRIGMPRQGSFPFIFDDITGFELTSTSAFQAVLVMDVLARCDFTTRRDGTCSLMFG